MSTKMKKILFILLVFLPLSITAQKMVIIPDGQQGKFQEALINWHSGVDCVQIKSGEWVIAESDYKRLPVNLTVTKTEVKDLKPVEVTYNIKTELSKLPVRTLTEIDFKEAELIEAEPIIEPKLIK